MESDKNSPSWDDRRTAEPQIAVCICTTARPALLARALAAVAAAELAPWRVRVIVVDNRPGTGAEAVVGAARPSLPVPIERVEEARPGISFARNRAVAAALERGADLVAFIDDDDTPLPDWLKELMRVWQATGADIVFGSARHPPRAPIPRWLASLDLFQPRRLDRTGDDGLPQGISTCNVLLACGMLKKLARAEEVFSTAMHSGSDIEFFQRAKRAGFTTATAPASQIVLGWDAVRYTAHGVLYRKFDRGMARVHRAILHGTPQPTLRRQAWRRLLRALRKLPPRLADRDEGLLQLVRVTEHAGEVAAALGLRSRYYRGSKRPPSSSSR
jgi:GT2 family glycosyltransferase